MVGEPPGEPRFDVVLSGSIARIIPRVLWLVEFFGLNGIQNHPAPLLPFGKFGGHDEAAVVACSRSQPVDVFQAGQTVINPLSYCLEV